MDVLNKVYSNTLSLSEYLESVGCPHPIQIEDKVGFRSFMQTTIVAETNGNLQLQGPVNFKHCSCQDEVVGKAVKILKARGVDKSKNVLLFGKASTGDGVSLDSSNQTLVKMPNWEILLTRVGDEVMLHLLVNLSLFLFAPPSCYIQACGVPIYDLISRPSKIPRNSAPESDNANTVFTMASICHRKKGCNRLPKSHALECLPVSVTSARRLLNSILPAQMSKKLTKHGKSKIQRTPRRFIPLQRLLKDLLAAHKKTNIAALLDVHCPILRPGVTGQMSPKELQPLLNNTIEPWRVFLFLRGVLLRAIPFPVWGSLHNRQAFLKFVEKFTKLGRGEKLELEQLVKKIKVADCDWTQLKKLRGHSPCRSDVLMQQHMVSSLLSWIMSDYVMALIKSAFYVTETSASRNGVVYFLKPTWNILEKIGLQECVTAGNLKPISDKLARSFIASEASFGCSSLRFVPKSNSLRPITNMRQPVAIGKQGFSINTMLEDVYDVLRFHRAREPSHLESSVLSVNEAYKKWKRFVLESRGQTTRKPLYFVKVDIAQCYDSIPHSALYDVIVDMLQLQAGNRHFTIYRYATVSQGGNTPRKAFRRHTHLAGVHHMTFHQMMLQLAQEEQWKNTVLINRVSSHSTSAENVMALLKKHVGCDIVKFSGQHYLRQKGIPQGSIISSWLCNYFYAAMEARCLPPVTQDELMMRLLDDFLFVTPHLERAEHFLRVLLKGLPQYGCHANPSKTLTNFPFRHDSREVRSLGPTELFPWCGLLFNTETLEVCNDYTRYKDVSIRYTLSVDSSGNVIDKVKAKLLQALQAKCTGFFLDSEINFLPTIRRNVYEMLLMSAFRFHSQLRILPSRYKMGSNAARKLLSIMFRLIEKLHKVGCPLNKPETKWLCLKAFQTKLQLHHSSYRRLLKLIKRTRRRVSRHLTLTEMETLKAASTPAVPQAFREMRS